MSVDIADKRTEIHRTNIIELWYAGFKSTSWLRIRELYPLALGLFQVNQFRMVSSVTTHRGLRWRGRGVGNQLCHLPDIVYIGQRNLGGPHLRRMPPSPAGFFRQHLRTNGSLNHRDQTIPG